MREQDARARWIDADFCQHGAKVFGVGCVFVRDADDLQAVQGDFFVVKHADAGGADGVQKGGNTAKEFVIAVDEVGAKGRAEIFPGLGDFKRAATARGAFAHDSGRFGSFTEILFVRGQFALITPHTEIRAAGPNVVMAIQRL